jgi:hypothetical protein
MSKRLASAVSHCESFHLSGTFRERQCIDLNIEVAPDDLILLTNGRIAAIRKEH